VHFIAWEAKYGEENLLESMLALRMEKNYIDVRTWNTLPTKTYIVLFFSSYKEEGFSCSFMPSNLYI